MGLFDSLIKELINAPVTLVTETTKAVITAPKKIADAATEAVDEATKGL